jgi:hypothetical protein
VPIDNAIVNTSAWASSDVVLETMDLRQWPDANKFDDPHGKGQTQRTSEKREQRGLSQELLDDSRACGAERGPYGHLSFSYRTASEQQVRDVHTGDKQEACCGPEQDTERKPDITDVVILERDDSPSPRVFVQSWHQEVHLRLRLRGRDVRLQTPDAPDDVIVAALEIFRRKAHGHPDLGLTGESKRRRHHTDDGECQAVHADEAADNARIRAEPPLPQGVTEKHDLIPPGRIFFDSEAATDQRRDAKQLEEVRGHAHAGNSLGQITLAQIEEEMPECRDVTV